jgi:GntR family transcriptional regulator
MILNIDLASDMPIYQQLRDQIVEAIAEGVLTEGNTLPAKDARCGLRDQLPHREQSL